MMTSFGSCDATLISKDKRVTKSIGLAYFTFAIITTTVMRLFSDLGYSSILTLGAGVQCLGFFSLLQKVQRQKSVAGLSKRTLEIYRIVIVLRLCCTLTHGGYLPVDRSGDWVYQAADALSLYIVHVILQCIATTHRSTYQEEYDTMDMSKAIPVCILLAVFIHGHLNDSFVFDTIWQASTNLDTVAMIPQLWMLTKIGGEVEGMTAHFVVAQMVSRACSLAFWVYAFKELGRNRGPNVAGWKLLACHGVQLLLSADFLYHYMSARIKGRRLVLPVRIEI